MGSTTPYPAGPDDRLTTLLSQHDPNTPYFSLEFFPPKTRAGFANLQPRLTRMTTALRPLFVTVTWGAGGSTATKSLELAEICQRQLGVPTVLHLTCTNMSRKTVDEALEECVGVGIRNILALRGDPPREEYKEKEKDTDSYEQESSVEGVTAKVDDEHEFVWAADLVRYIRRKYGDYFCIGVAGYPEGHADESHPEAGKQSVEHDLLYLAGKVREGADFIMTQLTYDAQAYEKYEARLRGYEDEQGRPFTTIPIIPGLMPIQSYQIIKRITKLSHARIPDDIMKRIESVKNDDDEVKKVGVDIISELVAKIRSLPLPRGQPRGLHFYTLNLEKSVAYILERCKLIPSSSEPETPSDGDDDVAVEGTDIAPSSKKGEKFRRRLSSINAQPHNRVIVDRKDSNSCSNSAAETTTVRVSPPAATTPNPANNFRHETGTLGAGIPADSHTRNQTLLISEGQGSLGREATWDDFPNGRWGPSHSPAFGQIDGYGPSLKVGPITARKLWGHPSRIEDIRDLFKRHINGSLASLPWSDDVDLNSPGTNLTGPEAGSSALRTETDIIRAELLHLIEQEGYLTLASQPAVDAARSGDPVFGWGPKGEGFVFQKAFVEFFCPLDKWPELRQRLVDAPTSELSWMAVDANGGFESTETVLDNDELGPTAGVITKRTLGATGINAVTWGVFRGKEIMTPTIIEPESFRAWGEEAYSICGEWRMCFPRGSREEKCIEGLRRQSVLVNVVGQQYVGGHQRKGKGLWTFLGCK